MHYHSPYRLPTLDLAEQHYLAALTALSAPVFTKSSNSLKTIKEDSDHSDDEGSLISSHSQSNRSSLNSHRSSMSSNSTYATSVSDDVSEPGTPTKKTVRFCTSLSHVIPNDTTGSPQHGSATCAALMSPKDRHVERYNVHLTGFINMLHSHIASVRYLKHVPPPTHFERSSSRNSNPTSRSRSTSQGLRGGMSRTVVELEALRKRRENLPPRERFNQSRYEELCRKALAEL